MPQARKASPAEESSTQPEIVRYGSLGAAGGWRVIVVTAFISLPRMLRSAQLTSPMQLTSFYI
jgi:hypothetical protein